MRKPKVPNGMLRDMKDLLLQIDIATGNAIMVGHPSDIRNYELGLLKRADARCKVVYGVSPLEIAGIENLEGKAKWDE